MGRSARTIVSDHSHSIRLECVRSPARHTIPANETPFHSPPTLLGRRIWSEKGRNSLILVQKGSNLPAAMSRVCARIKLAGVLIKWNVRGIQLPASFCRSGSSPQPAFANASAVVS